MSQLFEILRESSTPKQWSAGVELARTSQFVVEPSDSPNELIVRVVLSNKGNSPRVALNSEIETWQCDCSEEDDPCRHVIAVAIAERQQQLSKNSVVVKSSTREPAAIVYRFSRKDGYLSFTRVLRWPDKEVLIESSLSKTIDLSSGRERVVVSSREDHAIDHVLGSTKSGILPPNTMRLIVPALRAAAHVELDGESVKATAETLGMFVTVTSEKDGFRIRRQIADSAAEIFRNGVAFVDNRLVATADVDLTADQLALVEGSGTFIPGVRAHDFASVILPSLEKKIRVDVRTNRLPRPKRVSPRLVLELHTDSTHDHLTVVPKLLYGSPPIAELQDGHLVYLSTTETPIRDANEEARLSRRLNDQLGLKVGVGSRYSGARAVDFVGRITGWEAQGEAFEVFSKPVLLTAQVEAGMDGLGISFVRGDEATPVSFDEARQLYRKGERFIRLGNGLWCELPTQWLSAHGERIARLLAAREESNASRAALLLEAATLAEECGGSVEPGLAALRQSLTELSSMEDIQLPPQFCGDLRPYQVQGAKWLSLLVDHGIGALLADDMGLGKTVQVLAILKPGKTLIVAPASVVHGWQIQAAKFRPDLRIAVYHGASRTLPEKAEITLTTYGLLRRDIERLSTIDWDLVVLDESQTIKNPDSQVSRAAFELRAKGKISLSGTPIENDFEDLWSQFRFLNPGLLGSRSEFVGEVDSDDRSRSAYVRKKITPFILRRLKNQVAKDLPPRTEVVLECDLDDDERLTYESIAAASREEIVNKLGDEAGFLSILEAILRLRQACCHLGLVPGFQKETSSKCEVLLDSLTRSVAQGHRALVFSQWTSFLDLLEPLVTKAGLSFSRLDGSTKDRQSVVEEFQRSDGPNVMLLSLKAGGVGLTLTAADHVYILDPWWNPAVEDQAADRAHRIGQDNPVVIYKVVAKGTIEERILELQSRKKEISTALLDPSSKTSVSRAELLELIG